MVLPQDPVQAAIIHALNNHCHEDAIFLSERLFAEAPNDNTEFLLATCYYQAGKKTQVYKFLRNKGCHTARCKYLFSRCCYDVERYSEAENVLTGNNKLKTVADFTTEYGEIACFALSLLGDICRKTERNTKAVEYYQGGLAINPFMWTNFSKICKLGGKVDPKSVFHKSHVQEALNSIKSVLFSPRAASQSLQNVTQMLNTSQSESNASTPVHMVIPLITSTASPKDTFNTEMCNADIYDVVLKDSLKTPAINTNTVKTPYITPSFGVLPLETPIQGLYPVTPAVPDVPQAPIKRTNKSQPQQMVGSKLVFGQSSTSNTKTDVMAPPSTRSLFQSSILPRRRSKRISESQNAISVKENSKVPARSKFTKTSLRKYKTDALLNQDTLDSKKEILSSMCSEKPFSIAPQLDNLDAKQRQSAGAFLTLLQDLGTAHALTEAYDMKAAIKKYEAIPSHQYDTGWVLAELGRAYLELSEYKKAEDIFKKLREIEPHQVRGMETYSTILYHLQEEVALSALAQDMVDIDKLCPQTWCVNGNCFSLQKEHESAIKFLHRAIQVDESFAYAYTLLGHEYTLTEDYEKAMSAFRSALRVDSRHYNAWYGLGMIYYKKEKFLQAETHFKKAFSINPQSAVLLCHIGLVQHALQKHDLALETLNRAVELSPKNPMCLFHRASMLVANDHLEEALTELDALKVITPKESLVYFLIGKVHKKLGNAHLSLLNFSWATDLDPKGANNHIKEAIDRRYINGTEEDDEDDDDESQERYEEPSIDSSILNAETPDGPSLSTDSSILMDSDEVRQLHANDSDESL